jgi:hypothetical protein
MKKTLAAVGIVGTLAMCGCAALNRASTPSTTTQTVIAVQPASTVTSYAPAATVTATSTLTEHANVGQCARPSTSYVVTTVRPPASIVTLTAVYTVTSTKTVPDQPRG